MATEELCAAEQLASSCSLVCWRAGRCYPACSKGNINVNTKNRCAYSVGLSSNGNLLNNTQAKESRVHSTYEKIAFKIYSPVFEGSSYCYNEQLQGLLIG